MEREPKRAKFNQPTAPDDFECLMCQEIGKEFRHGSYHACHWFRNDIKIHQWSARFFRQQVMLEWKNTYIPGNNYHYGLLSWIPQDPFEDILQMVEQHVGKDLKNRLSECPKWSH